MPFRALRLSGDPKFGATWNMMKDTIGANKHQLPKSEADRLRLRTLGKLWSKPRVRLFLDHIVDMGPQGHVALLHRECGKSGNLYQTAYTRYKLTDVGRSVLRQYRARSSCTELLAMMPPPLFVLEWEEVHGADVCCDEGGEGGDEARNPALSHLCGPRCVAPLLCGSLPLLLYIFTDA